MIFFFKTRTITVDKLDCHVAMSASFMENAVQFFMFCFVLFSPITMKTFNPYKACGERGSNFLNFVLKREGRSEFLWFSYYHKQLFSWKFDLDLSSPEGIKIIFIFAIFWIFPLLLVVKRLKDYQVGHNCA